MAGVDDKALVVELLPVYCPQNWIERLSPSGHLEGGQSLPSEEGLCPHHFVSIFIHSMLTRKTPLWAQRVPFSSNTSMSPGYEVRALLSQVASARMVSPLEPNLQEEEAGPVFYGVLTLSPQVGLAGKG